MNASEVPVGVIMGSESDWTVMQRCVEQLRDLGIACEVRVLSAHRTPQAVDEYAASAADRGIKVVIAAAGMSAALGGAVAARTALPVLGVAIASGPLAGVDALLATVQMPPGVPVGCVGIGAPGAVNAAVLAAEILALDDDRVAARLREYKTAQEQKTLEGDRRLRQELGGQEKNL